MECNIIHYIPDNLCIRCQSFAFEVGVGFLAGAQQQRAYMVGEYAIDFFRRCQSAGAHAGFQVDNRNVELCGRESAGQSGIRVAINEDAVRPIFDEIGFYRFEHASGHGAVRQAANPKVGSRLRQLQFPEKGFRELEIIVLTGMNKPFGKSAIARKRAAHRRRLDELRPRTCYSRDFETGHTAIFEHLDAMYLFLGNVKTSDNTHAKRAY